MTEFWGRVKEIFFDALDLEPEEVPAFLDAACGDDPQLRAAVERLLAEDEQSGTRLEPPWDRLLEKEVGEGATKIDTLGDFDLLREIGRGGRGIVYLARQRSTGRRVALKVLDRAARVDPLQRERFRREAVATARLDHPGIVGVLEAGEQDGIPFLAMEFVAGTSLADELRQGPAGRLFGSTDEPRVVIAARCVARIAEALEHAHSRDVVHRDVKPQNILVDARLEPRLVDFGLARDLAEITITLDLEGTPNYMSPEQIAQQRLLVDHRTDIYSLGVILYEMLTGTRPFAAPTAAQILHNVTSLIPKPVRRLAPDVPIDLETICHCAMAKRPSDRYRSAGGLAADLESFLAHRAIAARPPGPIARATAWADRHRVACTVLLLLTLVLGGILLQPVVAHAMAAGELAGRLDAAAVRIAAGELPADLGELHARLARWRRERGPGGDGEPVDAAARRFAAAGERRELELQADVRGAIRLIHADGRRETLDDTDPDTSSARAAAARALSAATMLRGGLDLDLAGELLRGPDTQFRLTVESDSGRSGQEVRLQRVDPATGQLAAPELLGTAPLADVAVAAGLYRLTVVEAGYGFAELVVALRPSVRPAVLRAFVRASTDVTATMREIAAGPFEVRQTAFLSPEVGVDEIALPYDVAGFWLDPRPVTNADYEAFCAATGHRRPAFWPAPPYPTEWADKPVVMVALDDARRFAEWSGKRLPTRAEWELAARGSERAKFPWRTDDVTPLREAVVGRAQLDVAAYLALPDRAARLAFEFEHYLRTVADVGHLRPAARGPHDLHDLVGNVWEWVDARPFNYVDGEVVVATDSAYRLGAYYGVARDTAERAGLERYSEAFAFEPHSNTGFRCAKSRAPLQR